MTAAQILAKELGVHDIRVNSMVPGLDDRSVGRVLLRDDRAVSRRRAEETYDEIASEIALGTIPTDDDCAKVAVFLASDLSSAMTGQAVDVNGGEVFH